MKNENQRRWERNFTRIGTKSTIKCFILRVTSKVQPMFMRVDFRSLCLLVIMCLLFSGCSEIGTEIYGNHIGSVYKIDKMDTRCQCYCEYKISGINGMTIRDSCGKYNIDQPLYVTTKKP